MHTHMLPRAHMGAKPTAADRPHSIYGQEATRLQAGCGTPTGSSRETFTFPLVCTVQIMFMPFDCTCSRAICDCTWENLLCNELHEILVSCIFDKLHPRANLPPSLTPIARFALELERFVCDHATPTKNEKLWPKGVAMYAYSVSIYYVCTGSQLNGLGRGHS